MSCYWAKIACQLTSLRPWGCGSLLFDRGDYVGFTGRQLVCKAWFSTCSTVILVSPLNCVLFCIMGIVIIIRRNYINTHNTCVSLVMPTFSANSLGGKQTEAARIDWPVWVWHVNPLCLRTGTFHNHNAFGNQKSTQVLTLLSHMIELSLSSQDVGREQTLSKHTKRTLISGAINEF